MCPARADVFSFYLAAQEDSRSLHPERTCGVSHQHGPNKSRRDPGAVRLLSALVTGRRPTNAVHCWRGLRDGTGGRRRMETEGCRLPVADALGFRDVHFYRFRELDHQRPLGSPADSGGWNPPGEARGRPAGTVDAPALAASNVGHAVSASRRDITLAHLGRYGTGELGSNRGDTDRAEDPKPAGYGLVHGALGIPILYGIVRCAFRRSE